MDIPKYILTETNITIKASGQTITIVNSDPRYKQIRTCILTENWEELLDALNLQKKLETLEITEPAEDAPAGVQRIILEQTKEELTAFHESCKLNPNPTAVKELYDFLKHTGIRITTRGSFLSWKKVKEDYKDCHTGKVDNHPGQEPSMPRAQCDPNRHQTCSTGFHSANYNYARSFSGSRLIVVETFPENVTSVPSDYNFEKLRCCKYKVIAEYDDKTPPDEFLEKIARDIAKNEEKKNVRSGKVTPAKPTPVKAKDPTPKPTPKAKPIKETFTVGKEIAEYALQQKKSKKGDTYIFQMIESKFKKEKNPINLLTAHCNTLKQSPEKEILLKICKLKSEGDAVGKEIAAYALHLKNSRKGDAYIKQMIEKKFENIQNPIGKLKHYATHLEDHPTKVILFKICAN
jgi:hypothetical protein